MPLLSAGPVAAASDHASAIDEREVVVLQVAWRNRALFARSHLPQDVVYLSRLFVETVAGALDASGGTVGETNVDGVTAVFGLTGGIDVARRQALAAAGAIDAALDGLRRRYAAEFGAPADFAVIVHQGHGAIGEGSGRAAGSLLAAGEAFDTLALLRTTDAGANAAIVVSASALGSAGAAAHAADAGLPWRDVTRGDGAPPLRVAAFANAARLRAALAGT